MKRYLITRHRLSGRVILERYSEKRRTEISPRRSLKVWNHSPTGFEMGYCGSGPAQLALAILLDCLPKDEAIHLHQKFKWDFIALSEAKDGLEVSEEAIKSWAQKQKTSTSGQGRQEDSVPGRPS